jgi:V/A-type H+-transporting ATPase subunit C
MEQFMAKSVANYALAAKVKAMYGRRLTPQNYKELLRKQTVNEVAAYLKQQTSYIRLLSDINENLIHRGQLENILKKQFFDEYIKMFYFINQDERKFYDFVVIQMEIDELLSCIRFINAGRMGEYIFSLPEFFVKHSNINIYGLTKVRTFSELQELLSGTPYYDILKQFEQNSENKYDTIKIEIEFKRYYYTKILSIIEHSFSGKTKDDVLKSFGMEIDFENLMLIMRLKKYFNASNDYINNLLLPFYFKLKKDEINKILQETDISSIKKAIFDTYYGKILKRYNFEFIEKYGQQASFEYHKKLLRFSFDTPTLVVSFMQLKHIELNNIINIIEGIRYALPAVEINKLLIGTEE